VRKIRSEHLHFALQLFRNVDLSSGPGALGFDCSFVDLGAQHGMNVPIDKTRRAISVAPTPSVVPTTCSCVASITRVGASTPPTASALSMAAIAVRSTEVSSDRRAFIAATRSARSAARSDC
jgi:hypothetical protein